MNKGFFITGSDTGVGKTFFSSILLQKFNYDYWKPIQTGSYIDNDTLNLKKILNSNLINFHKSNYSLKKPLSPHLAAKYKNITININNFKKPKTFKPLIVEGAGGILVPLNKNKLMIDLIKKIKFPVIIISKSILGTINHTLMTIEILKKNKVNIFGVVLNNIKKKKEGDENAKSIQDFGGIKVLVKIPAIKKINKEKILNIGMKKSFNVFKL